MRCYSYMISRRGITVVNRDLFGVKLTTEGVDFLESTLKGVHERFTRQNVTVLMEGRGWWSFSVIVHIIIS